MCNFAAGLREDCVEAVLNNNRLHLRPPDKHQFKQGGSVAQVDVGPAGHQVDSGQGEGDAGQTGRVGCGVEERVRRRAAIPCVRRRSHTESGLLL